MTVKISKPAVNLREELNELKKPTGVAGEAMLRAETSQEQFNLIGAGRRNLLINGGFDVWQRGTTFTNIPTTNYSADRWKTFTSNGAVTVTKENNEYYNYAKWDITTLATSDYVQPSQVIEQGITPSTTFAVSFLAKGNGSVRDVEFRQSGSTSTYVYNSKTLSSEWKKHTFIVTTASNVNKDAPMSVILHLQRETSLFEMTQFQVELGSVATPFEHRSYGEELALCQRYFNRLGGGTYTGITTGMVFNNTSAMFCITYPVPMRAGPTISSSGLVVSDRISYDSAVTSFQPQGTSTTGIHFKTVHASNGASPRQAVVLVVQNNGTGYMDFNAEL